MQVEVDPRPGLGSVPKNPGESGMNDALRHRYRALCALPIEEQLKISLLPFAGLTCGAKTRNGTPCKMTLVRLYPNGRCKFHGGASTGPRTKRGKAKAARNGFKRAKGALRRP